MKPHFSSGISDAKAAIAAAALAAMTLSPAHADQTAPAESAEEVQQSGGIRYQEHRIGNRLERITILRENGFDETYRNNRDDTLWSAHENEIGEMPNMRQWIISTW